MERGALLWQLRKLNPLLGVVLTTVVLLIVEGFVICDGLDVKLQSLGKEVYIN